METNHHCEHETEIIVLKEHVNNVEMKVNDFEDKLDKILEILKGNGKKGLVTEIEVLKGSTQRLWWFVSVICIAVVGLIIRKYLG